MLAISVCLFSVGSGSNLDADVYAVEENDAEGVWQVDNILLPVYDSKSQFEPYTLCIEVDNAPGVLNQVKMGLTG